MKRMTMLILGIAAIATGTIAAAQDGSGILRKTEFFSDPDYTNQTGELVEYCDGTSTLNGEPDVHSRVFEYSC